MPSSFRTDGFNDWKHAKELLSEPETSDSHRSATLTLLKLSQGTGIKSHLPLKFEADIVYWRKLLIRVVEVVKSVVSWGAISRNFRNL